MQANTIGGHRNVKQIVTVEEPTGTVSRIYTVTQRTPSYSPSAPVSPIGKIRPGAAYSLLRKDFPPALKSKTTPSILRKGPKRKFILIRDPNSGPQDSVMKSATEKPNPQNVVATVQCASTSNEPFLTGLNGTDAQETRPIRPVTYRTYVRVPRRPEVVPRIKEEVRPVSAAEICASSMPTPKKTIVKRILVRRSVPVFQVSRARETENELTPERSAPKDTIPPAPAQDDSMPEESKGSGMIPGTPISIEPIPTDLIKSEAPDEFIVENCGPLSHSTESTISGIESSTMDMDFTEEAPGYGQSVPDQREFTEIMDDFLEDMSKNMSRSSESFYMVSHESLMDVLSTCNICASAADVTLLRKGTTCEANIKCRKTAKHDAFWDGEKCRSLGRKRNSGQRPNSSNSHMLHPCHDVPWSLILLCVIAKIVDIPLKKLEHLCRLLFSADNIGRNLQAASSLATSFPMIHGLTIPKLEKPMDHLKLIVVCRKLLVFLDPFNYSPLACFEFPGARLLSTCDLSSALNIGLQRLQLLNSNKFSSVDVIHSNTTGEDSNEWKPVLVPDMDLMYQEALTSLHVALWQNKFEFDIKSSRLRSVLEDITKALCFFQPEMARISELEGRSHYSLVLQDLLRIHDSRYVPKISEIALLRSSLQSLTSPECKVHIETLIREVEQIDVHNILSPLYQKIISTADASYVVSIRNEEPCRATHKVMNMIEMCQEEELSLENSLRVLLLLPLRGNPIDVIENICGLH